MATSSEELKWTGKQTQTSSFRGLMKKTLEPLKWVSTGPSSEHRSSMRC